MSPAKRLRRLLRDLKEGRATLAEFDIQLTPPGTSAVWSFRITRTLQPTTAPAKPRWRPISEAPKVQFPSVGLRSLREGDCWIRTGYWTKGALCWFDERGIQVPSEPTHFCPLEDLL